jgi:hypothetical protein
MSYSLPGGDAMDILTFIARMIDSIAWPSAMVMGIWLIRKDLFKFVSSISLNIRYKDWAIDIKKQMSEMKGKQDKLETMIANINRTEPRKN